MLLQTTGQWREAVSAYSTLLSLDDQNVDAFVNSAICKHQLGDFSGALAHINTAELQPDTSFMLNIKGSIEQVIGYTEKAQVATKGPSNSIPTIIRHSAILCSTCKTSLTWIRPHASK